MGGIAGQAAQQQASQGQPTCSHIRPTNRGEQEGACPISPQAWRMTGLFTERVILGEGKALWMDLGLQGQASSAYRRWQSTFTAKDIQSLTNPAESQGQLLPGPQMPCLTALTPASHLILSLS